ncbi:Crp/Fnr family transcriptional regulator [Olivibacter sp. XZL3]|uniref:Crp/Fnr family transcriptional regulator n=1 Tax=Olivibacter sp. XZL3 TaxID=1735116 RepID=UPI0010664AC6|nr:Crp/Fnr family transcriptional regulator [Olivibacter sp. XZL3]
MERFFTFWRKYVTLNWDDKQFIRQHARVLTYSKNEYYIMKGEVKLRWCFVLEGTVAGLDIPPNTQETIYWVSTANDYFVGTKHPFSKRSNQLAIRFLENSSILEIPIFHLQDAQRTRPAFAELLHVLKQHKINQRTQLLKIMKMKPHQRFDVSMQYLPKQIHPLTMQQRLRFLNINKRTYYRSLMNYLRKNKQQ